MLQNAPMYSYIPAKDVGRARAFYEGKLGFKPKMETAGGVIYEFGNGTACFLYPTPSALAASSKSTPAGPTSQARRHRSRPPTISSRN